MQSFFHDFCIALFQKLLHVTIFLSEGLSYCTFLLQHTVDSLLQADHSLSPYSLNSAALVFKRDSVNCVRGTITDFKNISYLTSPSSDFLYYTSRVLIKSNYFRSQDAFC